MRLHPHRAIPAAAALATAAALAVALPLAAGAASTDRPGALELAPIVEVTPESISGAASAPSGGESLLSTDTDAAAGGGEQPSADADLFGATGDVAAGTDAELDQPLGKLRQLRAAVAAERDALQQRLLRQETQRSNAEERYDRASDALASRLVQRFEDGDQAAVQALIDVRDEGNPQLRASMLASMQETDRAIIQELDAAAAAVDERAKVAESTRAALRALSLRVSAIDAVIEDRRPLTKRERDRASGKRYSIDADLVFTTGPIPGIGYWGDSTGGGMLTGWTGFAGAALGGVGCSPPEGGYQASGSIETGEASWYGPGFHGNNTANGEVYDQNAMTAAHKTLPFGSIVRVFSSSTGRCAFVRINDRGPFIEGRIIDLSHAAAQQIGMSGTAAVQIEVWSKPG